MRFQEVSEGNLFQMLRDVMEQLERKFLIKPVRFEGLRRIEELEYPVPALREMLLNALVHRNYMGSMTQLKVMDDRLSLWNAGALPVELTIDKLFQVHGSIPRNPLIAEVCYRVGYIDSWGRGIEKITDACKQAGLPDPKIAEETGGILVELLKPQASEKLGNQLGNQLGNTKERILAEMKSNPKISGAQLAKILQISTTAVEKNIKQLRDDGLIERIGGTRGHWGVKK
jgi:ATP-dependent DNA helicase RecG